MPRFHPMLPAGRARLLLLLFWGLCGCDVPENRSAPGGDTPRAASPCPAEPLPASGSAAPAPSDLEGTSAAKRRAVASNELSPKPVTLVRGEQSKQVTLAELVTSLGPGEPVDSWDPYYGGPRTFLGFGVLRVLSSVGVTEADSGEVVFTASDGYVVRLPLAQLARDRAVLSYAEGSGAPLPPIGPRATDPAPLYLVWPGAHLTNLTTHPRPFSVVRVEVSSRSSAERFVVGAASDAVQKGELLFQESCVRCHALNRRGGSVGPDLNAPTNILSYRPEAQVRAYIRNPETFRYGAMPAHLHLTEAELDQLIEFLRWMGDHPVSAPTTPAKASH